MGPKRVGRRGIQLIEVVMVLPIVGLVLSSVALSVAGTQRALESIQRQAVETATVDRFAQQLREDVHRATSLPAVADGTLELERFEGTVRYERTEEQLVRRVDLADGRSRATFAIATGDSPWTVAAEGGLVRFTDAGGREVVAAWPGIESRADDEAQPATVEEAP
ncbi:type II secretion system protein [Candidatus Laterigemmans baculatus]|uniref:type II secretion system protein n=1 Tax=Candidatus Laterigemmans baculatus TaxID=2770505 RepID=UPI0013DC82B0|nr:type II secretion system protein [Candidatus Laterigemmans baculatus]